MELRHAIQQVTTIRSQLAATEHLASLRASPVAVSGLLAVVAAVVQARFLERPLDDPLGYLIIWGAAAVLGAGVAAAMVARRTLGVSDTFSAINALQAVRQFTPCLAVGATVTWFVLERQPELLWLLPGLWQMLFGLGNLAAARFFPTPAAAVGAMFLVTGACCLWLGERALAPWAMALPFAAGQLALAAIIWRHQRNEAAQKPRTEP